MNKRRRMNMAYLRGQLERLKEIKRRERERRAAQESETRVVDNLTIIADNPQHGQENQTTRR